MNLTIIIWKMWTKKHFTTAISLFLSNVLDQLLTLIADILYPNGLSNDGDVAQLVRAADS